MSRLRLGQNLSLKAFLSGFEQSVANHLLILRISSGVGGSFGDSSQNYYQSVSLFVSIDAFEKVSWANLDGSCPPESGARESYFERNGQQLKMRDR